MIISSRDDDVLTVLWRISDNGTEDRRGEGKVTKPFLKYFNGFCFQIKIQNPFIHFKQIHISTISIRSPKTEVIMPHCKALVSISRHEFDNIILQNINTSTAINDE